MGGLELTAGVSYRVVYDEGALDDPRLVESIRPGVEARVFHGVPVRMFVADLTAALVILPAEFTDGALDGVLVHPSPLLDALIRSFEGVWMLGVPIRKGDTSSGPSDDQRLLVSLLARGLTDASIARELGVSERTVQRRITRLQQIAGANSRFLLGIQAVKRGWI